MKTSAKKTIREGSIDKGEVGNIEQIENDLGRQVLRKTQGRETRQIRKERKKNRSLGLSYTTINEKIAEKKKLEV